MVFQSTRHRCIIFIDCCLHCVQLGTIFIWIELPILQNLLNTQWLFFLKNPTRCKVYPFHRLMSLLGKTENGICLRSTSYSIKRAQYIMVLPSYQIYSVSFSLIAVCILSNWEQYLFQFNVWFYKKCSIHNFFFCPTRSTEYRFRRLLSLFGSIGNSSSLRNIPISGRIESWIFQINGQR